MKTDAKDCYNATFGSWFNFVDHVEKMPWYDEGDIFWMGGTRADAFRLARNGWAQQTPKAVEISRKVADRVIEHSATGITTEINYDVTGAAYDPGAYMAGIPECWVAFHEVEEKCAVRIIVDGTVSAGVSKKTKIKLGTAVAALVMALDSAGHPVTVDLYFGGIDNNRGGIPTDCYIRIHNGAMGAVLDVDRMVYAIAHPLPMRGMAHTLWGHGVLPYSREARPENTHGSYDLWVGGGLYSDVTRWGDNGEDWVMDQYLKQTGV